MNAYSSALRCTASIFSIFVLASSTASGTILFQDNFDRAQTYDIDKVYRGITAAPEMNIRGADLYLHPFVDPGNADGAVDDNRSNGAGACIKRKQLQLAVRNGSSNMLLNRNIIYPAIVEAGGFSIQLEVDLTQYHQRSVKTGNGGGFAVGMAFDDAMDSGDGMFGSHPLRNGKDRVRFQAAMHGQPKEKNAHTEEWNPPAVSDFWIVLRCDGNLVWGGRGSIVKQDGKRNFWGMVPVETLVGVVHVDFRLTSFNAGDTVNYTVYYNGSKRGNGQFEWTNTESNFIGLDARHRDAVVFDNFEISLPAPVESPVSVAAAVPAQLADEQAADAAPVAGEDMQEGSSTAIMYIGGVALVALIISGAMIFNAKKAERESPVYTRPVAVVPRSEPEPTPLSIRKKPTFRAPTVKNHTP